jgi:hypothetical protein
MLRTAFLAAPILLALAFAVPVEAAAPRVIMVSGPGLCQPVILDDWPENLDLMESIALGGEVKPEDLIGRPYLEMGLFWGPEWVQYVDEGKPIDNLRMEEANQYGRFYQALDYATAAIVVQSGPMGGGLSGRLGSEGMEILARHGVPASASAATTDCPSSVPWGWIAGGAVGGAALLLLIGAAIVLRRRQGRWLRPS